MKRVLFTALASGLAIAASAPANAATTVNRCDSSGGAMNTATSCNIMFNGVAGTFGNPMANTSPFVDIYEFDISQAGLLGLTLSSVASGASADVSFSLVRLNPPMGGGSNVLLTQGSTGTVEFYSISNLAAVAGNYRLRLEGTIANPPASYSGTISFAPRAVPEPATWAMMVLGFGVVGGVVRRRKASVAFA